MRNVVVVGGSTRVQAEVKAALTMEAGRSLLRISSTDLSRRTAAIPDLVSVSFDRSFPHTLRIRVTAEHAVMLLRRGSATWVVSARGRVMRKISSASHSNLPRVWVPRGAAVDVGATLTPEAGGLAAAALAPIAAGAFPANIRFVRLSDQELTLMMGSGLEVRLGDIGDLRLKLAIAKRILRVVGAEAAPGAYIDVSVPERPVLGAQNPQVGG